jgi:hypothetical protein
MKINKMKTVSLRDMHPMQVQQLMELVGLTLNLAANTRNQDVIDDPGPSPNDSQSVH